MKKKIIIALLAIVTAICYTLGFTACANGDNNGGGGEDYSGTYYLFEDEQYIEVEYYTLDGKNWSDAHNMGGTYEIKDGVISFYIDLFNQKTLWQQGAIGNGKLTLEGFSGKMEYYKKGMAHVHSFSEWQTVIEPDCTRAGEKIRACKCGETERQPVPALGHDLTKHIVYIPATCQSGGKMSKTCDRCGQLFEEEFNKDPDAHYIEEGKDETTCSGCGTDFGATFGFEEKDNEVILTDGDGVNVIIPAVYHGKPVTTIGDDAFDDCTSIVSITISDSVIYVGEGAFDGCRNLVSIIFGDGSQLETIGRAAFWTCTSLESVNFGNDSKLETIGGYAFYNCTSLESITIPDGVTSIGYEAFYGCTQIIQTEGGVSYVDKWVIGCDTSVSTVNLRADTRGFAGYAFGGCTSLTSITIPDGVISIGENAFDGCRNLVSIIFGDGSQLETIGRAAFWYCTSLESIIIPYGVTFIDEHAFGECENLKSVTFANKTGWKISKNEDMSNAQDAPDLNDPAQNAEYLKGYYSYRFYYWKREV